MDRAIQTRIVAVTCAAAALFAPCASACTGMYAGKKVSVDGTIEGDGGGATTVPVKAFRPTGCL